MSNKIFVGLHAVLSALIFAIILIGVGNGVVD